MIRAEKHEVESIAASCATGLERAWAENDRLLREANGLRLLLTRSMRERIRQGDELHTLRRDLAAALDTVESLSQQLDARPANTRIVWLAVAGGLGLWLGLIL